MKKWVLKQSKSSLEEGLACPDLIWKFSGEGEVWFVLDILILPILCLFDHLGIVLSQDLVVEFVALVHWRCLVDHLHLLLFLVFVFPGEHATSFYWAGRDYLRRSMLSGLVLPEVVNDLEHCLLLIHYIFLYAKKINN